MAEVIKYQPLLDAISERGHRCRLVFALHSLFKSMVLKMLLFSPVMKTLRFVMCVYIVLCIMCEESCPGYARVVFVLAS